VIAGKDKGTVAEVEKVLASRGLIVVKGVNKHVSHVSMCLVSLCACVLDSVGACAPPPL
jgi:ribosomal protein L24